MHKKGKQFFLQRNVSFIPVEHRDDEFYILQIKRMLMKQQFSLRIRFDYLNNKIILKIPYFLIEIFTSHQKPANKKSNQILKYTKF